MFIPKKMKEYLVNYLYLIILGIGLSINDTDDNLNIRGVLGLFDVTVDATAEHLFQCILLSELFDEGRIKKLISIGRDGDATEAALLNKIK